MNELLGSAAILGVIAASWQKIKMLWWRIMNLFVVNLRLDGDLAEGFLILAQQDMYRSPYGERYFGCVGRFVQPLSRVSNVAYERFNSGEAVLYWQGWKPMLVQNPKTDAGVNPTIVNVSFIRGTWDADQIITDAMDKYNETASTGINESTHKSRRFFIMSFVGSGKKLSSGDFQSQSAILKSSKTYHNTSVWDAGSRFLKWRKDQLNVNKPDGDTATNVLAFPDNIVELIDEMKRWRKNEDWYRNQGVPWRHGWLLYGKPGTGKSSLVRALGIDCDLPILTFDLASMSNSEFIAAWKVMLLHTPCIALFEDIDGVFRERRRSHLRLFPELHRRC
jgi:hypothetical protein